MAEPLTALQKRLISGLILAPVILIIIILGEWYFIAMVAAALLVSAVEFSALADKGKHKYLNSLFGFLYLSLCFVSYLFLRMAYDEGMWLAMAVILCVWASDTGAYAAGKKFGGPKMAPGISPNKTWAGLGGAMVSCGLALVIMRFAAHVAGVDAGLDFTGGGGLFLIGLFLGIVGQAGDLFISFYKRRAGAKDTGALIPGHGGLLDRIDALLLVSPVFLGIFILCQ